MPSGLRFAQEGYDIYDPDYLQTIDTNWPTMDILHTGQFVSAGEQVILNHNLGFAPAFMIFTNRIANVTYTDASALVDGYIAKYFLMNSEQLTTTFNITTGIYCRYYIFNLNLEESYTAPNVEVGSLANLDGAIDSKTGVKFAKDGYNLDSPDFTNYSFRSDTRSPIIHSVTPGKKPISSEPIVVPHDLGYPPRVLVYADIYENAITGGSYQIVANSLDTFTYSNSGSNQVEVVIPYSCKYSIVLLKNPVAL